MESFDIDSAMLAAHSKFDAKTFVVTSEFAAEDDYLDEMEAEFGVTEEDLVGGTDGKVEIDIPENAQQELIDTLRDHDGEDIDDDKTGASRRPGFEGSVGNKSLRSQEYVMQWLISICISKTAQHDLSSIPRLVFFIWIRALSPLRQILASPHPGFDSRPKSRARRAQKPHPACAKHTGSIPTPRYILCHSAHKVRTK